MSEHQEQSEEESQENLAFPKRLHSPEDIQHMADFLSKGHGRPVSKEEATEALNNLTRFCKWLYDHQDDLNGLPN